MIHTTFFAAHRNGLRSFPTFFINILTMYGNILVYFKLPDWVTDFENSLIENDDDPSDVCQRVKVCCLVVVQEYRIMLIALF